MSAIADPNLSLEFENWDLAVIWDLDFGICLLLSARPLHRVHKNPPHFRTIIVIVRFMARGEIKNSAFADRPAQAHPRKIAISPTEIVIFAA